MQMPLRNEDLFGNCFGNHILPDCPECKAEGCAQTELGVSDGVLRSRFICPGCRIIFSPDDSYYCKVAAAKRGAARTLEIICTEAEVRGLPAHIVESMILRRKAADPDVYSLAALMAADWDADAQILRQLEHAFNLTCMK